MKKEFEISYSFGYVYDKSKLIAMYPVGSTVINEEEYEIEVEVEFLKDGIDSAFKDDDIKLANDTMKPLEMFLMKPNKIIPFVESIRDNNTKEELNKMLEEFDEEYEIKNNYIEKGYKIIDFYDVFKNVVDYIEIDVQRTKDREYVLNHDKTFERVSYNKPDFINKKTLDLNLDQIKTLDIGSKISSEYAGERVPTIEEVLDLCKNNININLELKEGVDNKMMDDLMDLVKKKGMKKQVFFTSLNINHIKYIEEKDSTFDTGIIYFIKLGNYNDVVSDYMIMEEREATESSIKKLHKNGKKVIVWTVNTQDSIDKFSKMDIDGIISDYPIEVKEAIDENAKMTPDDLIMSSFVRNIEDRLLP